MPLDTLEELNLNPVVNDERTYVLKEVVDFDTMQEEVVMKSSNPDEIEREVRSIPNGKDKIIRGQLVIDSY